jgi:hypothetical protein
MDAGKVLDPSLDECPLCPIARLLAAVPDS